MEIRGAKQYGSTHANTFLPLNFTLFDYESLKTGFG